jgi:hypothetical protein
MGVENSLSCINQEMGVENIGYREVKVNTVRAGSSGW